MKEYEGVCRYCQSQEFVIAEDEQDANRIVEDRSNCIGKKNAHELEEIKNRIENICQENNYFNLKQVDRKSVEAVKGIAEAMQGGGIRSTKIDLLDSAILMKRSDTFSIRRETKVSIEAEV